MKKFFGLLFLGVLALVVIGGITLRVVDPDKVIDAHKDNLAQTVSEALGREVQLGEVTSHFWPRLGATLENVVLCRADGCVAPHQINIPRVDFRMSWIDALLSFGKKMRVTAFTLYNPQISLRRNTDESWDIDDIIHHLRAEPDIDTREEEKLLDKLNLKLASIENAEIVIDDRPHERTLRINKANIEVENITYGEALTVQLDALLHDGQAATPLSSELIWGELRRTSPLDPLPDLTGKLKLEDLDVSSWSTLIPEEFLTPRKGILSIFLDGVIRKGGQRLKMSGHTEADGLVLGQGDEQGSPATGVIRVVADIDKTTSKYDVSELDIDIAGLLLKGHVKADGLSPGAIQSAHLVGDVANFEKTLSVIPTAADIVPKDLDIKGALHGILEKKNETFTLAIDADRADIVYGDLLRKRVGTELGVRLSGSFQDDRLNLPKVYIGVGKLRATGSAQLPRKPGVPYVASIQTGVLPLADLRTVSPVIDDALKAHRQVRGAFQLDVQASDDGGRQKADIKANLTDLKLDVRRLAAVGNGAVHIEVRPEGSRIWVRGKGDLTDLGLFYRNSDNALVINKPRRTPMGFDLDAQRDGDTATITAATLSVGKTLLEGKGTGKGFDSPHPHVDIDFGNVALQFQDLRQIFPDLSVLPKTGSFRGPVKVTGDPTHAANEIFVESTAAQLQFDRTTLAGSVKMNGFEEPVFDVALKDSSVYWADILRLKPELGLFASDTWIRGNVHAVGDLARPKSVHVEVKNTHLTSGRHTDADFDLTLTDMKAPKIKLAVRGERLNVDQLLPSDPSNKASSTGVENDEGLSVGARDALRDVSGTGTVKLKRLVVNDIKMENVNADFVLNNSDLFFEKINVSIFGGTVSADESSFGLGKRKISYHLQGTAEKLKANLLLDEVVGGNGGVTGTLNQVFDLRGSGLTSRSLATSLLGRLEVKTGNLGMQQLKVIQSVSGPLRSALRAKSIFSSFQRMAAPASLPASKTKLDNVFAGSGTTLKNINAWLNFDGGVYTFPKPFDLETNFGVLNLQGAGKLDGTIDIDAKAIFSQAMLKQTFGQGIKLDGAAIPFHIGGTWKRPKIDGVNVTAMVAQLAKQQVGKVVDGAVDTVSSAIGGTAGEAIREGRNRVRSIAGGNTNPSEAAKDVTSAASDAAKKEAQKAQDAAKEAAKNAADVAKKKAHDAAQRAKKIAERKRKEAEKKAAETVKNLLGF